MQLQRSIFKQAHYAASTINLRLAAVRRVAYEASDAGLLSPDLAAGIRRVKGIRKHGVRIGKWLTVEQGQRLLHTSIGQQFVVGETTPWLRFYLVAVFAEPSITVEDLQRREEHWVFADLIGKGGHIRTVPIPTWFGSAVCAWLTAANVSTGPIFRAINKAGRIAPQGFSP